MSDLVKSIRKRINSYYSKLELYYIDNINRDSLIKISIAISLASLLGLIFLLKRKASQAQPHASRLNNGFINLIKPSLTIYNNHNRQRHLSPLIKKFYSFPAGITNFGNNCYLNSLIQVTTFLII